MNLTIAEKRIYEYIVTHDISLMSAEQIARELYVSRTSIYRLCRKLGYTSFSHFKFVQIQNQMKRKEVIEVDSTNISSQINDRELDEILGEMRKSHKIYVLGTYATTIAAQYFVRQLANLGFDAVLLSDKFELESRNKHMTSDDLVIFFSNSGILPKDFVQDIKDKGIMTIAITSENTMLSKICDYSITFDFSMYKDEDSFDRENIFNLIVVAQKVLVNLKAILI